MQNFVKSTKNVNLVTLPPEVRAGRASVLPPTQWGQTLADLEAKLLKQQCRLRVGDGAFLGHCGAKVARRAAGAPQQVTPAAKNSYCSTKIHDICARKMLQNAFLFGKFMLNIFLHQIIYNW